MRKKKTTTTSFDIPLSDIEKMLRDVLPGAREAPIQQATVRLHRALRSTVNELVAETNIALNKAEDAERYSKLLRKLLNGKASQLGRLERIRKEYQQKSKALSKENTALRAQLRTMESTARRAQEDRDRIVRAVWAESTRSRDNLAKTLPKGIGDGEEETKH